MRAQSLYDAMFRQGQEQLAAVLAAWPTDLSDSDDPRTVAKEVTHGQPVDLTLTGPAGGHLVVGHGGDQLTIDAIEFCRVLSGRSTNPHPLMAHDVPF